MREPTVADKFRRRRRARPDAPAIVFNGHTLTYEELGRQADALAALLHESGVVRGDQVAVALPHSPEHIAVLLAVVEAGAVYVPLDLAYPAERLGYMAGHAGPRCLVTTAGAGEMLTAVAGHRSRVLLIEELMPRTGATVPPAARWAGPGVAYVIYTSGSTGRPKGVSVSHASLTSNLRWVQRRYGLRPDDRVLHKTPLGFDVSVWEMFWPLTTGATLVIAPPEIHQDPAALAGLMRRERVTVAHFVPSMLQVFLDVASLDGCDALRMVVLSGEAVPAELCRSFLAASPASLHNLYGPTEATIHVTSWDCPRPFTGPTVPIGRPADRTDLHVLDEDLRPVPDGEAGELYIGGAQVALGYLHDPAQTAERFVACPFAGPGERMYRTGDRARRNPGGDIEYLGRSDLQVKINGVRIEIAEVEAALERHPAVRQAAAVVARAGTGDPHLTAVVTLRGAAADGADRLLHLFEAPATERPEVVEFEEGLPICVTDEKAARSEFTEVLEGQTYTGGVFVLPDGACVLDIGAGIGMFTLAAGLRARDLRLLAVESRPELFDALRRNVHLYALDATLLPFATGGNPAAPTRTVSQILDEENVTELALLKADLDAAGADVLDGIEDRHWPGIDRIALRTGGTGFGSSLRDTLAGRGFTVRSEIPADAGGSAGYLYAVRGTAGSLVPPVTGDIRRLGSLPRLIEDIRATAATLLHPAMVPSAITAVSRLPLTPNGKLDRQRVVATASPVAGRSASTPGEEAVCALIGQIAGVSAVGADDNVFGLGITSLGAVKLTAAISKRFGVPFKLRMVVEGPTAAALARRVDDLLAGAAAPITPGPR